MTGWALFAGGVVALACAGFFTLVVGYLLGAEDDDVASPWGPPSRSAYAILALSWVAALALLALAVAL